MTGKDLTEFPDLSREDVDGLLTQAAAYKRKHDQGIRREDVLEGRVVALVFEKPSLRTKVAFEVATRYLGGTPVYLSSSQILASGNNERGRESIPDIARNLERFADLIVARVYRHEVIRAIARSVRIPVVNALCDRHHPTQALADLMALRSRRPGPAGDVTVAYVGDGNNVATSLLHACATTGVHFAIASPDGYEIPAAERQRGRELAAVTGAGVRFLRDPAEAVRGADAVYTDTFLSMGQEEQRVARAAAFAAYQVNAALMAQAKTGAVFMHCLPAHRGEEVTDEVMDSPSSIVFDQAECRLHVAKAILTYFLGNDRPGGRRV
jgi:ornithine carbamoyltransferase